METIEQVNKPKKHHIPGYLIMSYNFSFQMNDLNNNLGVWSVEIYSISIKKFKRFFAYQFCFHSLRCFLIVSITHLFFNSFLNFCGLKGHISRV